MRVFVILGAVFISFSTLLAQAPPRSLTSEYADGIGTAVLSGASLDEVWTASVKALMLDKYRVVLAEKASGLLNAERKPAAAYNHLLMLVFEEGEGAVKIQAAAEPLRRQEGLGALVQQSGQKKAHEKLARRFFENLAMALEIR